MGKLIVPLIIGLLMGISGGGFFSVFQAGKAHAAAVAAAQKRGLKPAGDSTHTTGDSTAASDSTAHGGGEQPASAVHDTAPLAAVTAATAPETAHPPDTHAPAAKPTTPVTKAMPPSAVAAHSPVDPDAAATAAATQTHQRRLAKIFATMGPKDAARVLAQMSDHDVSIILGLLGERQTAAILTNLPAPRAAALSQVQPRRGGGTQ